ncbi:hypothetical protein BJ138DRAFT_1107737, partial [Hygrophoropsis aurantiaca]
MTKCGNLVFHRLHWQRCCQWHLLPAKQQRSAFIGGIGAAAQGGFASATLLAEKDLEGMFDLHLLGVILTSFPPRSLTAWATASVKTSIIISLPLMISLFSLSANVIRDELKLVHLPTPQTGSLVREGVDQSMAVIRDIRDVTWQLASEHQVDRRSKYAVWFMASKLSHNIGLQFELEEQQNNVEKTRILLAEKDQLYEQLTRRLLDARKKLERSEIELKAYKLRDEQGPFSA